MITPAVTTATKPAPAAPVIRPNAYWPQYDISLDQYVMLAYVCGEHPAEVCGDTIAGCLTAWQDAMERARKSVALNGWHCRNCDGWNPPEARDCEPCARRAAADEAALSRGL